MKIDVGIFPRQQQSLVMTQALRQALLILALPHLELARYLRSEIEKNPLLDMEGQEGTSWETCEGREDLIPAKKNLQELLMAQAMEALPSGEISVAREILGNLDEKGFFTLPLEEIARSCNCAVAEVAKVVKIVQTFDPPGIAARDIRENFLLQLRRLKKERSIAYKIIEEHYEDFLQGRIKYLERNLSLSNDQVLQIIQKELRTLRIHPVDAGENRPMPPIKPDLILEEGKALNVDQTELPSIDFLYEDLLEGKTLSKEEKRVVQKYVTAGKWLIRAIDRRKSTLKELGEFLLKEQGDYLKGKTEHLLPLNMRDAARALQVGESTIARAVQDKYILCPRGVIPIKSCFSYKLELPSGKILSNKTAKLLLLQLIKEEDKMHPYSDEQLAEKLRKRGVEIARRTIAKYRKQLKILSALQRKRSRDRS